MKIDYDSEADALYIQLREALPVNNIDVDEANGVSIDIDDQGAIVGIEVLGAAALLGNDLQVTVGLIPEPAPA